MHTVENLSSSRNDGNTVLPAAFRPGNLLLYLSSEDGWIPSKLDWQDFRWMEESPDWFWSVHKPIPINDKYLSTIEYIHFTCYGIYGMYGLNVGEWGVYDFTNDGNGFHTTSNNASITNPLNWLHELQNHFYTTTGKELSVNLEKLEAFANEKEPDFCPTEIGDGLPF